MAAMTMLRSIAFSRATASAICKSSSRLALTAIGLVSFMLGAMPALAGHAPEIFGFAVLAGRGRTLGFLAPLQRLGDQFVGEHKLRFCHLFNRQQDNRILTWCHVGAAYVRFLAVDAQEGAAEAAAAVDRNRHFDFRDVS